MEEVLIVTRDENGKRTNHYMLWDRVCSYVDDNDFGEEDEILLVIVEETCIYSALGTSFSLCWDEITGFFA